jgi:hypothetical protein
MKLSGLENLNGRLSLSSVQAFSHLAMAIIIISVKVGQRKAESIGPMDEPTKDAKVPPGPFHPTMPFWWGHDFSRFSESD